MCAVYCDTGSPQYRHLHLSRCRMRARSLPWGARFAASRSTRNSYRSTSSRAADLSESHRTYGFVSAPRAASSISSVICPSVIRPIPLIHDRLCTVSCCSICGTSDSIDFNASLNCPAGAFHNSLLTPIAMTVRSEGTPTIPVTIAVPSSPLNILIVPPRKTKRRPFSRFAVRGLFGRPRRSHFDHEPREGTALDLTKQNLLKLVCRGQPLPLTNQYSTGDVRVSIHRFAFRIDTNGVNFKRHLLRPIVVNRR